MAAADTPLKADPARELSLKLCQACSSSSDDSEAVMQLLEAGARVNYVVTQRENITPLLLALGKRHEEISQLLVWANADLTASTADGCTALHMLAESEGIDPAGARLVRMLCSVEGYGPMEVAGLERVECVLESRDCNGNAPLATACYHSNVLVAESLLDAGADPNARADEDLTPLMLCFLGPDGTTCGGEGVTTLVQLLLRFGARVNGVVDSKGLNVLHYCRACGQHGETLRLLLEREEEDSDYDEESDPEERYGPDGLPNDPMARLMAIMCEEREADNEARGVHEDEEAICRHVVNSDAYTEALTRRGALRGDHLEFNEFMFGRAPAPTVATASSMTAGAQDATPTMPASTQVAPAANAAHTKRVPWTEHELEQLRQLAGELGGGEYPSGDAWAQIANQLGRSAAAAEQQYGFLTGRRRRDTGRPAAAKPVVHGSYLY
jgi:hypothetical protein